MLKDGADALKAKTDKAQLFFCANFRYNQADWA